MSNLADLNRSQPGLVRRLCEPSSGDHIGGTPVALTVNRSTFTLDLPPDSLAAGPKRSTESIVVLGVGTGDQLKAVLESNPEASVTAWDRDPAMIRLALQTHLFGDAIREGRLQWALGEDLIHLPRVPDHRRIVHPLLGQIYGREISLLDRDPHAPRILMCSGGLFIDDVADCFEQAGLGVYTWDTERQSAASLRQTAEVIAPELVFAVNYTQGLAEACAELALPLIVWEIDPATDGLRPVGCPTDHVHIHTYRQSNVARFEAAGFRRVSYTPLAANTERRTPAPEGTQTGPPVCFVGASMVDQAMRFRTAFFDAWQAVHTNDKTAKSKGMKVLNAILTAQRARPREYVIPGLMRRHMADFMAAVEGTIPHDPVALVAEIAAAERRLTIASRLGNEDLHVWGDPGWRMAVAHGVVHRGYAGHRHQLTTIYQQGQIHIDINRLYQLDIVPMRVFDILACRGFLIAEYSPALAALFDLGIEVESWSTVDELIDKVRYYKDHPHAARRIALKGHQAVCQRHTIAGRIADMLRALPAATDTAEVG